MGVAPAGSDKANAGHHHLLIDAELPPLDQPIPSDFNHLHFGAGQTEAEVTLPEGEHTLQLVLGDNNHIPNTIPLISERIKIRVVAAPRRPRQSATQRPGSSHRSSAGRKKSPPGAKVYFVYPTNRGYVTPTPVIRFGLIGMGVAPAGFEKVNTGHHHLLVDTELPHSTSRSRATSTICISAPARPRPRSRCRSASIRCNCCWPTRTMSRTIRRFFGADSVTVNASGRPPARSGIASIDVITR